MNVQCSLIEQNTILSGNVQDLLVIGDLYSLFLFLIYVGPSVVALQQTFAFLRGLSDRNRPLPVAPWRSGRYPFLLNDIMYQVVAIVGIRSINKNTCVE